MADSAALAATLLSAVALLRAGRAENDRSAYLWTGLCGAALAYAVVTRWGQAWLAPVWLVAAVGATPRRPANPGRRLLAASIAALAILLPQLWLAAVTPRGAVRPRAFMGDFGGAGSTWQLRHLLERTFTNSDGTFHYALPNLLYYASGPFRSMYLTPLILPALVLGALQLRRLEASAVALLTLWPGTLLLVDGGLAWQDPRFILMAVPPLAIVSGFGFAVALARWPAWRGILLLLIAVTTLAIAGGAARGLDRLIASSRADLQVAAWTHDRLPSQYTLLSFEITETLQHHGVEARELSALAPAQLDRLVSRQSDVFLLVRPSTVTGQAQFLNPGRDFVTLSATKRLRAVGTLDGYTLYRVKRR
ncbi:MAG TPA: hypothetical protein VKX16_13345, partial [Chloroflexota bacterium]|nr:hypothetical protein [Chloroflexota bacterium]